MHKLYHAGVIALLLAIAVSVPVTAQDRPALPGANVESLLVLARERNPEYASMRLDAEAAAERIEPAGALPDPKLRIELQDITMGGAQSPTLQPNRVGSTRYLFMQELPWSGKRDLKRDIAALEADGARARALGSWADLSARIKAGYAQFYYLRQSARLATEILDLMRRLEQVAQVRYAGGLALQQDVIRAQLELTRLKNELIALENEQRMSQARLNTLVARPTNAALAEPARLRPLPAPAQLDTAVLQERVRARNPLVFAEDARLKSAEKARELAYKNRYPDFTVGIAPLQARKSIREWELMVELNIPLQQGARRSQEREAEAMRAAAQARKEATVNQALNDLSDALSGLDAARRTDTATTTSLLPQAELTFKSALASYESGKIDFSTLLDAQRQSREARQSQIKAQAEGQMRLADIERLLGEDL